MKITERGQVTIPRELRERYGFLPDTEVDFVVRDGALQIVTKTGRRRHAIEEMYGRKSFEKSTDALMERLRG